ncbi:recombinase family protein [Falsochrobactrum ovis]|uniref:recombinase family protein n=1 Tax=Falsochrobactrum ovis TaxID=1293442 RepID=UPI000DBA55C8
MRRVAIYARYSTDLQSDTSIEDQVRICMRFAESKGWQVVQTYSDHAVSGANMMRPGIQALMADARAGQFDIIVAEAQDRLSRDMEDMARLYKHLTYAEQAIHTVSEGHITQMHVGIGGMMSEMYISELRRKTHRGLEGRALAGKCAGGKAYGYNNVRKYDSAGNLIPGDREINTDEAAIVERIFRDYVKGKSPKKIAFELNREGVPCPSGKAWGATTIYGNRQRGTGILNNELYIGRQIWNKQRYVKNPETGKRVAKPNPQDKWVVAEVPDLRIIDQALWDAVKEYQGELDRKLTYQEKQRPPKLLSFLLKCGCCGGGMSIVAKERYGCSTARNKGTCDNRITISQNVLEERVLSALRDKLMNPELTKLFCDEYVAEMNRLRMTANADIVKNQKELEKTEKAIRKLVEAIKNGIDPLLTKDEINDLSAKKDALTVSLNQKEEVPAFIHPRMGERYATAVRELIASLNDPDHRDESAKILRGLIDKIILTPNGDKSALVADLHGDLAGILQIAQGGKGIKLKPREELNRKQISEIEQVEALTIASETVDFQGLHDVQVKMVAGAGFEPAAFRL